jgi:hypothetical protein
METVFTHGAVGDDNTTPTAGDTTLGNEDFRSAIDNFDKTTFANKIIASLQISAAENNGNDVKESGWFDAAAAGNLQIRNLLNTISKTSDIQLFIDTEITITVTEV